MHSKSPFTQLLDCLIGLEYAIKLGWFNYKTFNLSEYEHYEKLENGDLNWILPNKFIAFSSPSDKPTDKYGVPSPSTLESHLYSPRLCPHLQKTRSHHSRTAQQ